MRIFFTFICLISLCILAKSQSFDEAYEFRDGFRFEKAFLDSASQLYFFSTDEFAVVDENSKTWNIIDTFKTDTKSYEINYIHPVFTHFGSIINKTSFSTKDSSYICFFNKDTTIVINALQLNPYFKYKNTSGYSNHKFWFSGYWDNIYTFDEQTLTLDSLPLDSVNIHQWNLSPMNFHPYKDGFIYLGQFVNKIYYYSENEKWQIDLDSIVVARDLEWISTKEMDFDGKRLLLSGWKQRIGIFDIESWDFNVIDLTKTNLLIDNPDVLVVDSIYYLEPKANFDCQGNIYVSIHTLSKGVVKYKQIDNLTFEHLEHKDFSVVYKVQNSGRNTNWYSGLFEENGKTYYKAVEYFPEGNSIEAFPTIVPINVYPNPATTYTNVKFYLKPSTRSKVKFKIYNYMGQLIKELDNEMEYDESTAFAIKRINTLNMKTGMYYLLVDNDSQKRLFGFAVN